MFSRSIVISYILKNILLDSCDPPCNASCQICENNKCRIADNSCYIANQCYAAHQSSTNESFSCLQCQPEKSQTDWSFNPQCSAGLSCGKQEFLANHTCRPDVIKAFYRNPEAAMISLYDFTHCEVFVDHEWCLRDYFFHNQIHP